MESRVKILILNTLSSRNMEGGGLDLSLCFSTTVYYVFILHLLFRASLILYYFFYQNMYSMTNYIEDQTSNKEWLLFDEFQMVAEKFHHQHQK